MNTKSFPESGILEIGCNYWGSHAGTNMWRNWDATIVERDLSVMEQQGMTLIRVFPQWPDFQPVIMLCGCAGVPVEYGRPDGTPLEVDSDGLDSVMLERFRTLGDLAQMHHLKLIVALLTGWMSGHLLLPPVLDGRNLFTDPEALRWEGRFIRGFIAALKDHPAIVAWEPGNECNCLSKLAPDQEAASWHWLDFIAGSIRSADPSRPVYSGMHGGHAEPTKPWNLFAQGELYDALTTHPYPFFTPDCGKSAVNTLPAVLHSTAETLFYSAISGKPAFIEEIGSLGPGVLSSARATAYIRTAMISAWAHDCRAFLWWCGFDQTELPQAPYRWHAMERELGLFTADHQPHDTVREMEKFSVLLKNIGFDRLPPRQIDVEVLLPAGMEQWHAAYGAFLLSKQAGFEVRFNSLYWKLPDAQIYWVPANCSWTGIEKNRYQELLAKIREGAVLLVTDTGLGILQPFKSIFGCEIDYTARTPESFSFSLPDSDVKFNCSREFTRKLLPGDARALISDPAGNSILTVHPYGKGKVFYLNCAPEFYALDEAEPHWYKLYRYIMRQAGLELPEKAPEIGRTRHIFPDGNLFEININYSDREADGIPANSFALNHEK